eukprot:TRINITY_DN27290_c0_g1_i1.p1 TRINITY_DN27290_c0_g1~~TRINITY_DN27290_c0_g1_i1.p1  ORF type:complete len:469 (+),score=144.53 TRINITY_DN27290_c0_g1_i1:64-1470(+)
MGDSDAEEEMGEEEETFQEIDTSGMDDGDKSWLLGGPSSFTTPDEALEAIAGSSNKTLLVYEGTYGHLNLTKREDGLRIIGMGDRDKIIFTGCTSCVPQATITTATITGRGDAQTSEPALKAFCEDGVSSKLTLTNCVLSGGRNVVEVQAYARPTFITCEVQTTLATGVYCYPFAKPTFRAGFSIASAAPVTLLKPAPDLKNKALGTIPAGEIVAMLSKPEADEEGNQWAQVTHGGAVTGWINITAAGVDMWGAQRGAITGNGRRGQTAVFFDNAAATILDTDISNVETGVYATDRCIGSVIEDSTVQDVSGTGILLDGGSRVALRRCRVKNCKHYGVSTTNGDQGGDDEVTALCQRRENALAADETSAAEKLGKQLEEMEVTLDDAARKWTMANQSGRWGAGATKGILRENIFVSNVRLGENTSTSLFENVIVKPYEVVSKTSFAVNGVTVVDEEPKPKQKKVEEEE